MVVRVGTSLSLARKVVLVALCAAAMSSGAICIRLAEPQGKLSFSPLAASFFSELIKFLISLALMASTAAKSCAQVRQTSRKTLLLFVLPAMLFVVSNNLRFLVARLVNPGLVSVVWNLKIVVIAIFYQMPPFSRPLSPQQWAGAALLVLGATFGKLMQDGTHSSDGGGSNTGGDLGVLLLIAQLIIASGGSILAEYVYKSTADVLDFPEQCSLIYLSGTILNLAAFIVGDTLLGHGVPGQEDKSHNSHFPASLFEGFSALAWTAIFAVSVGGFLIGVLLKKIDSIAQVKNNPFPVYSLTFPRFYYTFYWFACSCRLSQEL